MVKLTEGSQAPEIVLQTDGGEEFRLSSLKGKRVVLFFYPKASTPGCTTEACEFTAAGKKFTKKNTVIVGISPDSVEAQDKFKTKYGMPFSLLADDAHSVADAYGVWKEKSMYGKKYFGAERTTFVIGEDGKILKIYEKVRPAGHAEEVLAGL